MEEGNGVLTVPSAAPEGQGANVTPSATVDPNLQQFVVPSADPSATPAGQGVNQGVNTNQATDEIDRKIQSRIDQAHARWLAEKQALEARLNSLQTPQVQTQENPYDPNTNYVAWQRFESQALAREAATQARNATREEFTGLLQTMSEQSWVQQNQVNLSRYGVSVDQIKAYNQMNGIAPHRLDIGFAMLTMPAMVSDVAQRTSNQTIQNFNKPQNGTIPVRGGQAAGDGTTYLSYEKLAEEYQKTNGRSLQSLPKEVQDMFWEETRKRAG